MKLLNSNIFLLCFCILFACVITSKAHASVETEIQYSHSDLSNGYGVWNDVNLFTNFDFQGQNHFQLETDYKNHFNESGFLASFNLTHTYQADWYQDFNVEGATNSKILPALQVFTELNRKLLADRSLVLGLGIGEINNQSPYSDWFALAELIYYFNSRFTFQAGIRKNRSLPGPVDTSRYYGLIQWAKKYFFEISYRYETGKEGYTIIGVSDYSNEIESSLQTLQAKLNLSKPSALTFEYERYQSSAYNRNSYTLGFLYQY